MIVVFARIEYRKYGQLAFISHLDLIRTWERIVRRARLPIAFTEGFHPKPRFSFIPPLPVGFEGEEELLDVKILEASPYVKKEIINSVVPEGIWVNSVEIVPNSDLSKTIIGGIYSFNWIGRIDIRELEERLEIMGVKEWDYSSRDSDNHTVENLLSIHIPFSSQTISPKGIAQLIEGLGKIEWIKLSRTSLLKR
jgi:radical SAM-linked protein